MVRQRIRLVDIANKTGFSVNTVSRALRGRDDISPKTCRNIGRIAKEMGYIHDAIAGSLRSGKTKTVAVILGDISNPHYAIMIKEIETSLAVHGYRTFVINTNEDAELEKLRDGFDIGDAAHPVRAEQFLGVSH